LEDRRQEYVMNERKERVRCDGWRRKWKYQEEVTSSESEEPE